MTIQELQNRITNITTQELITVHKIEREHEHKLKEIELQKQLHFNKWKNKVLVALIENGYEIEDLKGVVDE